MSDTTSHRQPPTVHLVSFGYLHSEPPAADIIVDVRQVLRDPARARDGGLLDLDGRDPWVFAAVLDTPGALSLAAGVYLGAVSLHQAGKPVTVAIGCAGGRHRSVALVEHLALLLAADDYGDPVPVRVDHLHVHLPRVLRDGDDDRQVR
ncbi:MAG: hypothetical protein HOY78_04400 [Saccharothrix sp.]|nr:hypothetical protein [Saccharothrix sp.]